MSNVNSEDPGPGRVDPVEGSMGGAYRSDVDAGTTASGRGLWPIVGTILVAILLLTPVVWITLLVGRAAGLFEDSGVAWIYAAVAVVIVAAGVWTLFRVVGQQSKGRNDS